MTNAVAPPPRSRPIFVLFRRLLFTLLAIGIVAAGIGGVFAWLYARHLDAVVVEKLAGRRWAIPSRVYSDALLIFPGMNLDDAGFFDRLQRLNYRTLPSGTLRKGDFRRTGPTLDLFLRDFAYPVETQPGTLLHLTLDGSVLTRIVDDQTGTELFATQLEPELITGLYQSVWEERHVVSLKEFPPLLVRAIIDTEDQRFYHHHGIDPIGILRAVGVNLQHGHVVQGGSTLTQQLVKNFFLSEERTLDRKLREAAMAIVLERHYGKDEILEAYLNEIYLGQNGLEGIFGVWEAAQFYFARPPQELSVAEIAMLAGLIRAPNRYSPYTHPQDAAERRKVVLGLLLEAGDITTDQYTTALAEPLRTPPLHRRGNAAPYFVDFLQQELAAHYPREILTSEGLRIFTGLDVQLQKLADAAVQHGLDDLERRHPKLKGDTSENRLQACLIALQPQTGEIKAMVGGREYRDTQYNRTVQSRRQPGSVFKPFVYLAAFEQTRRTPDPVTPATVLDDEPFDWEYETKTWSPENYRGEYHGRVTVRQALEFSLNAATARLANRIGLEPIRDVARRMGITSPLPPYPSMVLGAMEVSPFEVAQAYAVFANQGLRAAVRATKLVLDKDGSPIEGYPVEVTRVVGPETSYLVTHLMEGVIDHGTGAGARQRGFKRPAAGKTGTTNDAHDAWFAGFTPDLLTVVWVGYDQRRPLGLTGAEAALPIWTEFMKTATAARPPSAFLPPTGVALVRIDPYTGGMATPNCPETIEEAFLDGQEPTIPCPLHGDATPPPAIPDADADEPHT